MFENRGNIIDEWGKIMKIENIMKMLEVFWPIAIAIYGFFIYKFIPYMKTKIFINEYFFALSVIGLIYSFGISLIVKLKTKKQKNKKRNMSSICFLE